MKKYILKQTTLALLLTLVLCSCESYLDNPPKSVLTMKKIKDYEALLNHSQSAKTIGVNTCLLTDDTYFPDSDPIGGLSLGQVTNVVHLNCYTFEEELYPNTSNDTDWADSYKAISNHNVIMEGIMSAEDGTQKQKDAIYAEALLARAFSFNQLVLLYAKAYDPETAESNPGIPLILESDINQKKLTRASVQKVYDRIITDVEKALPMLPDKPSQNAFRGSKYAAHAFLARVYLQQRSYKKALEHAEESLKLYSELINLNDYEVINPDKNSGRNNVPERDLNPESVYIKFTSFVNGMTGRAYIDPELINLFNKETDRRFKLYITDYYNKKQREYYIWAQASDPNIGIGTPEVYLTAAECHARDGNLTSAMDRLEKLCKNRYENYTPISRTNLTQKEVIKLVLDERRKELMMVPGIRLADIKRLAFDSDFSQPVKRTNKGYERTIPPTSNLLIVPIPNIVMEFNPNMEQNIRKD